MALTWRTEASTTNGISASCGRHAALKALLAWSSTSTRAGDSSSASWKSDSWAK